MTFKRFISEEDSAAVIAQMRKVRDQMRVIKLKRQLEKEKDSLTAMKREKHGKGILRHKYS